MTDYIEQTMTLPSLETVSIMVLSWHEHVKLLNTDREAELFAIGQGWLTFPPIMHNCSLMISYFN